MPDILVRKSALFSGGRREVIKVVLATAEGERIPDPTSPLELSIGADADVPLKIGGADDAKLAISADASASLTPIFNGVAPNRAQLKELGIETYFDDRNADRLLMLLALGAKVAASGSASTKSPVSVEVGLKVGAEATYLYGRSFPETTPAKDVLGGASSAISLFRPR